MSQVLAAIAEHARRRPRAVALKRLDGALDYADLHDEVRRAAEALDCALAEVPAGVPVAVAMDNGPAAVVVDLALLALGRPCAPIPPFFTADQTRHVLDDAGAGALVTTSGQYPSLRAGGQPVWVRRLGCPPVPLHAGTAKITYTSGSTSQPKGVCLSVAQMEAVAQSLVTAIGAEHVGLHLPALPLAVLLENVAGLYATLIAGGAYLAAPLADVGLGDPFRPDMRRLAEVARAERARSLILAPELLRRLVEARRRTGPIPSLDLVAVGGARVSPKLVDDAWEVGIPAYEGYGLTECASVVAMNTPARRDREGVGAPLPHLEVAIAPDGEIVVGPRPFLGYVGEPAQAGPFATGDLGRIDDRGRLHIEGRKRNVLITAFGRNVAPEWPESELLAEPEIAQALVFGEAEPTLDAILVPAGKDVGRSAVEAAVARANLRLPAYARIGRWRLGPPFDAEAGELTGNGRVRRETVLRRRTPPSIDDPTAPFFHILVAHTAAEQQILYTTPQLQDGLQGRVSRAAYLAYLGEAYHHVKHTVPLMRAAKARLDGRRQRFRDGLDEYIAEETGHEAWILDDIRAAGGDAEAVRAGEPGPATAAMVGYAYSFIASVNPMGFFGMVFVLEGTSVALASKGAEAVSRSLGLGPECFRYLTSHGALDQSHMAFFEGLMNEVQDPDDRRAIVEMARRMMVLFAGVFASIPNTPEVAHAV